MPPDNPFVGRAGAKPEIFTYGHRNGYGLAFHPETGELWQAEIGPMGGDEVNILLPGHNYGWPLVSMGRNYTGSLVSDQPFQRDGMDNARMFWVPSISPSSLMFYTGERFPQWRGNMFVGALNGLSLQRVAFGQPSQAERREPVLRPLGLRIRDVQQTRDGFIYVATELRLRRRRGRRHDPAARAPRRVVASYARCRAPSACLSAASSSSSFATRASSAASALGRGAAGSALSDEPIDMGADSIGPANKCA